MHIWRNEYQSSLPKSFFPWIVPLKGTIKSEVLPLKTRDFDSLSLNKLKNLPERHLNLSSAILESWWPLVRVYTRRFVIATWKMRVFSPQGAKLYETWENIPSPKVQICKIWNAGVISTSGKYLTAWQTHFLVAPGGQVRTKVALESWQERASPSPSIPSVREASPARLKGEWLSWVETDDIWRGRKWLLVRYSKNSKRPRSLGHPLVIVTQGSSLPSQSKIVWPPFPP